MAVAPAVPVAPDPEVVEQARPRFTAKYGLEVLELADRCEFGQLAPCCVVRGCIPRI